MSTRTREPGISDLFSIIISRRTDTRCRRSPDTGYGPIRTTRPILILLSRGNDLSNDVCRVHLHQSICMLPRGRAPGRGWLAGGGTTPARRRAGAAAGGRSRTARRVVRRRVPRCRPPRPRLTGLDRVVRESVTDVTTLPRCPCRITPNASRPSTPPRSPTNGHSRRLRARRLKLNTVTIGKW